MMISKIDISLPWVFVFFCFLKPAGFDLMGFTAINTFLNIARIVCALIVFFIYINRGTHNRYLPYLLFYILACFISTYFGQGNINLLFTFGGSIVSFALIWDIIPLKKLKTVMRSLLFVYMVLIIFSFFWMYQIVGFTINIEEYFTDEQLQKVYFLSSSNGSASFFIPAMVCAILNLFISGKNSLLSWITLVFTYISGLIIWSATSLVAETALLGFAICYYLGLTHLFMNYLKYKVLLYICLFVSIGITFFNIQYLFEFIIVDILHKDLTMTGRATVMQNGFNAFYSSPFFGLGNFNKIVSTCDNCYAQILGDTGLFGMITFILLMFKAYEVLKKSYLNSISYLFFIVFDLLLLMFVAEAWSQFFGLYVLLILFSKTDMIQYYIDSLSKKKKKYNCC